MGEGLSVGNLLVWNVFALCFLCFIFIEKIRMSVALARSILFCGRFVKMGGCPNHIACTCDVRKTLHCDWMRGTFMDD